MKSRNFVFALAVILIITIAPAMAKGSEQSYGGDVWQYVFVTVENYPDYVTLCWEVADPQPEPDGFELDVSGHKFSLELYGELEYNYGSIEPTTTIFEKEYEVSYSTVKRCITIYKAELTAMIIEDLDIDYLNWFTFSNVYAKVKGLDPDRTAGKKKSNDRRKRQDNWFSDPVFVFSTLEYDADL